MEGYDWMMIDVWMKRWMMVEWMDSGIGEWMDELIAGWMIWMTYG